MSAPKTGVSRQTRAKKGILPSWLVSTWLQDQTPHLSQLVDACSAGSVNEVVVSGSAPLVEGFRLTRLPSGVVGSSLELLKMLFQKITASSGDLELPFGVEKWQKEVFKLLVSKPDMKS